MFADDEEENKEMDYGDIQQDEARSHVHETEVGQLLHQMQRDINISADQGNFDLAEQQFCNAVDVWKNAHNMMIQRHEFQHEQEIDELEKTNQEEFQNFTLEWDKKIEQAKQNTALEINKLASSHQQQMEALQNYLEQSLSTRFKQSSELLNLKKIQENLKKQ